MANVKPCMEDGCDLPKKSGKHKCNFHYLLKQPIEIQIEAAKWRLSVAPEPHRARVPREEWPTGRRHCAGCQSFVPLWYCGKKASRCKACASLAAHSARVQKVYDITPEEYEGLMVLQGRVCFICHRKPLSKRLAVDHDHTSGRVRGLLCADQERGCNHAIIGNIKDLDMARRVVLYLEHPPYDKLQEDQNAPVPEDAAPTGDLRNLRPPAVNKIARIATPDTPAWVNDPEWQF